MPSSFDSEQRQKSTITTSERSNSESDGPPAEAEPTSFAPSAAPHDSRQSSARSPESVARGLRSGMVPRGISIMRIVLALASSATGNRILRTIRPSGSSDETEHERPDLEISPTTLKSIADEMGHLKGSVMKVGQFFSCYAERFLTPEVHAIFKKLQSQAQPLDWYTMRPVLSSELGEPTLQELDITPDSIASASIGQVYSAIIRHTGERVAIKVQYPEVEKAISTDLKVLRSFLSVAQIIPRAPLLDGMMNELQQMLAQELDYQTEADYTEKFRALLTDIPALKIPRVHREFSSNRVLTTEFIDGCEVDSPEVLALSQDRRDRIARTAVELCFREIFEFRMVQTDSHFGNYRIQIAEQRVRTVSSPATGEAKIVAHEGDMDRLILFDFGAVRPLDEQFVSLYRDLTRSALDNDDDGICRAAGGIGILRDSDSTAVRREFAAFCRLVVEPFRDDAQTRLDTCHDEKHFSFSNNVYDWARTDLPVRLSHQIKTLIQAHEFRAPPPEMIFLDRKLIGLFALLRQLKATIGGRSLIEKYLATGTPHQL